MIKAILFDLGEVLFTNDWHYDSPEKFAAYTDAFGISYDEMEKGWQAAWPDYELGKISEDAFWEVFLEVAEADSINVEKAKELWRKYFAEKPGMFDLLKRLKNYTLAIASSTGKEWLEYKKETYHLNDYFRYYFITCDMHMKKIDPSFFPQVIQTLHIPSQEILMVDDTQIVLDTAAKEGIETILFETPEKFIHQLRGKNIL